MKPPIKNCRWVQYPLGDVSQFYGENPELYMAAMGLAYHNGADLVRKYGEPLYAVEDGTVCAVKEDAGGHGKHIRLVSDATDERGYYRDWVYGHMSLIVTKNGQKVKAGDLVGYMGNSGFVVSGNTPYWEHNPTGGVHLHIGVRYLAKQRSGGWKYEGLDTQWTAVNYDNGVKGRVDPLPLFLDPALKSTKIFKLASARQDKTLYQLAVLLQSLGL